MKRIGNNNLFICLQSLNVNSFAIIKEFSNRKDLEEYYFDILDYIQKKKGKMIVCVAFDSLGKDIEYIYNDKLGEIFVNEEWKFKHKVKPLAHISSRTLENYLEMIEYYADGRLELCNINMKIEKISAIGSLGTKMEMNVKDIQN